MNKQAQLAASLLQMSAHVIKQHHESNRALLSLLHEVPVVSFSILAEDFAYRSINCSIATSNFSTMPRANLSDDHQIDRGKTIAAYGGSLYLLLVLGEQLGQLLI